MLLVAHLLLILHFDRNRKHVSLTQLCMNGGALYRLKVHS